MKKILITGGTGYLGRNLANFYKKKYKVFLGARNNKQNFLIKNFFDVIIRTRKNR